MLRVSADNPDASYLIRNIEGAAGIGGGRKPLGGAPLDLTNREYALLLHLAQRVDQVVPKSELLSRVWDTSFDTGSNLVEVHVSRLRDKLGAHAWMIETVRGVGYRLRGRRDP